MAPGLLNRAKSLIQAPCLGSEQILGKCERDAFTTPQFLTPSLFQNRADKGSCCDTIDRKPALFWSVYQITIAEQSILLRSTRHARLVDPCELAGQQRNRVRKFMRYFRDLRTAPKHTGTKGRCRRIHVPLL
jgi:hypothetical protein